MIDENANILLFDLLESMNDSIIVDKEGKIIFFSESYARDANINSKDVIGKPVKDVILNTRMLKVLESGKGETAEGFVSELNKEIEGSTTVSTTPFHICNRIPIRRNGDPNGEILGAFAYTSLETASDFEKMGAQLAEVKKHDTMMLQHLNEIYKPEYVLDSIIGNSFAITKTKELISRIAPTDIAVTITGETGTGKELIAGAIHNLSNRKDNPFIKINCGAIPDNLLESELFGYESGSFTGASKNGKLGKFELANNGTILLDEIGELPLSLQVKLLRVLQEREIERIGGKESIPLNVRVICSTNRDLKTMVEHGLFREDLYYRINVMEIKAPPLRERFEDLELLCRHFIQMYSKQEYARITDINEDVFNLFKSYSWPGNVRELQHSIECACVMADSGTIGVKDLDFLAKRMNENRELIIECESEIAADIKVDDLAERQNPSEEIVSNYRSLNEAKTFVEKEHIINTLELVHYNISEAAKLLNTNRSSLYRKLKKYNIYPYSEK